MHDYASRYLWSAWQQYNLLYSWLFKNAVSNGDYTASDDRMISEYGAVDGMRIGNGNQVLQLDICTWDKLTQRPMRCVKSQRMCVLQTGIHVITLVAVVFVLRRLVPWDVIRKEVPIVNTETGVCVGTSHATSSAGFKHPCSQCSVSWHAILLISQIGPIIV
jgi:hypothetical protein